MSDIIIHGLPLSSFVRTIMMVCENKGVPYQTQPVDFRDPAYRALHPFGKIPAFQHGEVTIFETLAMATYIDEALDGPALQPDNPVGRAKMMQWISATNDYLYASIMGVLMFERFIKPMREMETDEAAIVAILPKIAEELDVINGTLADTAYLCGDQLTLADLFLAPIIQYLNATPEGKTLLPERANITAWQSRMSKTPGFETINAMGG